MLESKVRELVAAGRRIEARQFVEKELGVKKRAAQERVKRILEGLPTIKSEWQEQQESRRSDRERKILELWSTHTNAKIAEQVGLSHRQLQVHTSDMRARGIVFPEKTSEAQSGQTVEQVQEIIQSYQRETGVISSKSPAIRTLDELLAAAKVDLSIWEVDRHEINQWQTARKNRDMKMVYEDGKSSGYIDDRGGMHVEPLWQVKCWLRRRKPLEVAIAGLLKQMEEKAPLLPAIKYPTKRKLDPKIAFELSIKDPHVGMQSYKGESDGGQTLESIAGTILQAVDDLIIKGQRAAGVEIFDEAFMPFGNDFTHTDNIEGTTSAGTNQPEALSYHAVYQAAEAIAIEMILRLRKVARKVYIYEIPGNHSRVTDYTLARVLKAYFRNDPNIVVDAGPSPYKFHRFGVNLIGFEHGHSVAAIRYAALMANERPMDYAETKYREWHLGDQHRKATSKPSSFEEQGVSIEYLPGLTAANGWHRNKAFNHQQRGAVGFLWDFHTGPLYRFNHNILAYES